MSVNQPIRGAAHICQETPSDLPIMTVSHSVAVPAALPA